MKLVVVIADDRDKNKLNNALQGNGLSFTKLSSMGGFLRETNVTFLVGVEDDQVDRVLDVVRITCQAKERYVSVSQDVLPGSYAPVGGLSAYPVEIKAGGAVAFVLPVDQFHRF